MVSQPVSMLAVGTRFFRQTGFDVAAETPNCEEIRYATEFGLACRTLLREMRSSPNITRLLLSILNAEMRLAKLASDEYVHLGIDLSNKITFPIGVDLSRRARVFAYLNYPNGPQQRQLTVGQFESLGRGEGRFVVTRPSAIRELFDCIEDWQRFDALHSRNNEDVVDSHGFTKRQFDALLIGLKFDSIRKRIGAKNLPILRKCGNINYYDYAKMRQLIIKTWPNQGAYLPESERAAVQNLSDKNVQHDVAPS